MPFSSEQVNPGEVESSRHSSSHRTDVRPWSFQARHAELQQRVEASERRSVRHRLRFWAEKLERWGVASFGFSGNVREVKSVCNFSAENNEL